MHWVWKGTENRTLRLCGSPVCDEHKATEGSEVKQGCGVL